MKERLQKIIAAAGIASRRQAEILITAGHVQVNGIVVKELGTQADPTTDTITVAGKPLVKPGLVTYAINKPEGYICSRVAQGEAPIVTSLVPKMPPVYPVGRLDRESRGLLILTNDGTLTQKLTHPSFEHHKKYRVVLQWKDEGSEPDASKLETLFTKGVKLSDGKVTADRAQVEKVNPRTIVLTFHQGKQHMIRRMAAVLGYKVRDLTRIAIGDLTLEGIKEGSYRRLSAAECAKLLKKV